MKFTKPFAAFVSGVICTVVIFILLSNEKQRTASSAMDSKLSDPATNEFRAPRLPAEISLFNEKVPLNRMDVREAFDRELVYNLYNQGHMIYIMKLASRYFPLIEEQLKVNGLPDDFKYLCVAESNLQNLVSRVGASGFWQFMKTTAPSYNLIVNDKVDERYHVQKSTIAACQYLKSAYQKFGNWTAAAASYNCGMGGYSSQATYQGTNNYYDLHLPEETSRYIYRILAFKHILTNARELGFILETSDLYTPYDINPVEVTGNINDLSAWAKQQGSNYKMIRMLNPWIRGKTVGGMNGKTYSVNVPAK
jgi:membrane-bound lytic murein transglycosylase D